MCVRMCECECYIIIYMQVYYLIIIIIHYYYNKLFKHIVNYTTHISNLPRQLAYMRIRCDNDPDTHAYTYDTHAYTYDRHAH